MLHSHLTTLNAVSLVLSTFAAEGLSSEPLLAGSGITEADLSRPDIRITTYQEMQVCANAVAIRAQIGLQLGRRMHVSSYGILGYALLTAATFGDALRLALEYPALLGTLFELELVEDGERACLSASDYRDDEGLRVFNAELCIGSLKVICDDLLGTALPLLFARFAHVAPDYRDLYAESFPCALRFGAEDNAFAFDRTWLDQPLPLADPITHRDMRERCRRQNIEFTGRQAWLGRIRNLLAGQLDHTPSLGVIAQEMNCSERSLRRHLHATGSSYQQLLDELRFERAKQLLHENRLPIHCIAEALGFSETASFRHAFIRWSGVAPSHYRG
jgi:AraC-like DNA-binding protein